MNKLFLSNFYINKINILSSKENKFLNVIEVRSIFLNSINEVIIFLTNISNLNKFIMLKNLKWAFSSTSSKVQKHDINFSLVIYTPDFRKNYFMSIFNKKYKLYNKLCFSRKKNLLISSLDNIKFIGFLSSLSKDKEDKFALVNLENDHVFKVKIGDYLGLEQFTVIGIYNDEILIQDKNSNKIKVITLKMESKKILNAKRFM